MAKKTRGTDKIPSSAKKKGEINQNIIQDTQKNPTPVAELALDDGPIIGEMDEYKPAAYEVVKRKRPWKGAPPEDFPMIVEDN